MVCLVIDSYSPQSVLRGGRERRGGECEVVEGEKEE